jgi:2-oxoglutarate dehydrogenase E1 component
LCSGKVYYDIIEEREKSQNTRTAVVRVEQLYPLSQNHLLEVLKTYPKAKNVVWMQEEPKNMGSWHYISFKLQEAIEASGLNLKLKYVGRGERSSPATGSIYRHKVEQAEIVKLCLSV